MIKHEREDRAFSFYFFVCVVWPSSRSIRLFTSDLLLIMVEKEKLYHVELPRSRSHIVQDVDFYDKE